MRKVFLAGLKLVASLLIDTVIFAVWIITHTFLFKLIAFTNFSGVSLIVFYCLESLFAIATIVPIALFLYTEILYAIEEFRNNYPRDEEGAT